MISNTRVLLFAAIICGGIAFAAFAGGSASAPPAAAKVSAGMPARVYAPYFETWTKASIYGVARRSGAHHLTLAFIETPSRGSCTPTWNGDGSLPVSGGHYMAQIAKLRRRLGGDVIPSFGGYTADHGLTEIADSCRSVNKLVAAYKSVITTLGATRLDMDVEDRSLDDAPGINRRNRALARVERWAERHGRRLQVQYTIPTTPTGLESDGLAVLRNAISNGTRVDIVNIMTFDYYDGTTTDMGAAALSAARGLFKQLHRLYPAKSTAQLWAMEGNTILPGIDDYPKKTETTHLRDARRLVRFARSKGIGALSIWAIQRDNGGCPGSIDEDGCSGIVQKRWAFSHTLEGFTGS